MQYGQLSIQYYWDTAESQDSQWFSCWKVQQTIGKR